MNRNADGIEARILADLRPVRPLARPWKRVLAIGAAGALAAAAVTARFGLRGDIAQIGPMLVWGLSALQAAYALVLFGAALRESVPGRGLARGSAPLLMAVGAALILLVTLLTASARLTAVPAGKALLYWRTCFETPVLVGLPSLAVALLLAFRAYPTRPALIGALAGLGAGLLADGSWRTYCAVTEPSHVLSAHVGAVALLTVIGMAAAAAAEKLRH